MYPITTLETLCANMRFIIIFYHLNYTLLTYENILNSNQWYYYYYVLIYTEIVQDSNIVIQKEKKEGAVYFERKRVFLISYAS